MRPTGPIRAHICAAYASAYASYAPSTFCPRVLTSLHRIHMLKRASDWTYTRSHLRATYATICAHICVQHTRLSALTSALPRPAYARILLLALQVFSHDLYSACFVQVLPSATARIPFAHIGEDLHSLLLVEERIADLIALKLALLFQARTPWQVNRCPCSLYDKLGVPAQKLD